MKRLFCISILILSVAFCLSACGGGGGGGGGDPAASGPPANIAGTWIGNTADGTTFNLTLTQSSGSASVSGHILVPDSSCCSVVDQCAVTGTVTGSTFTLNSQFGEVSGTVVTTTPIHTMSGNYTTNSTCSGSASAGTFTATCSDYSSDTIRPSAPTNLNATAASSSQIYLSWTASTDNVGVAGYKIYRKGTYVKSITGTTTSDAGLTASTQYCYTVSAFDAAGNESTQSTQACATTQSSGSGGDITPPSIPTGLAATAVSSSQINLSWNASTDNVGVVGYKIYWQSGTYLGYVTGLLSNVTGLSPSTNFCFTVSAYDAAGNESAQCAQQCATTLGTTSPPAGPTNISASNITQTSALLTWTDNSSNETGFEIGICSGLVSSSGNLISCMTGFTKVGQVGANATSYPLTGLTASTAYKYFVRAYNSAGSSSNLGIGFTTSAPVPAARYLRIVNDLYDQTVGSNLWGTWNAIIRVRIAATLNAVLNDSTNTYEVLAPYDSTCMVGNLNQISPKYQQTTSYKDFDVSSMPANYYVYIQTGWWDLDAWTLCWDKHVTAVICCDCANTCYKYAGISVTNHSNGTFTIKASQFLPPGNWCQSGAPFCQ